METTKITIEIDLSMLTRYSDTHLATLWHVAQANPASGFETKEPGDLVERIGREIIRRWLHGIEPELYHHQGRHYFWDQLRRLGSWQDGVFVPDGLCACGKPASHQDAHPDSPEWACRVPAT